MKRGITMDRGWIKLHRELMAKPIWTEATPKQKVLLITLLMMANHGDKQREWKGKIFTARPGQFVTSLPSLVQKCGKNSSVQKIRTALKRFAKYEFLTDESSIFYQLACSLFETVKMNNPGAKEPNIQKWSNDFRLIVERDGQTFERIVHMIQWSGQHAFWHTIILSPASIRRNWDRTVSQV